MNPTLRTKFLGWLAGSAATMLLLPWAAVTFVNSNAGMAVTLLLFFYDKSNIRRDRGRFRGKKYKGPMECACHCGDSVFVWRLDIL